MAIEMVAAVCGAFFILGAVLANMYCPLRESGKGAATGVGFLMLMGFVLVILGALSFNEGGYITILGGLLRISMGLYGFQAVRKRNLTQLQNYSRWTPHLAWLAGLFDVASIFAYVYLFGAVSALQWHRTTEDTFVTTAIIGSATDLIGVCWSSLCAREVLKEVERETFWMQ